MLLQKHLQAPDGSIVYFSEVHFPFFAVPLTPSLPRVCSPSNRLCTHIGTAPLCVERKLFRVGLFRSKPNAKRNTQHAERSNEWLLWYWVCFLFCFVFNFVTTFQPIGLWWNAHGTLSGKWKIAFLIFTNFIPVYCRGLKRELAIACTACVCVCALGLCCRLLNRTHASLYECYTVGTVNELHAGRIWMGWGIMMSCNKQQQFSAARSWRYCDSCQRLQGRVETYMKFELKSSF